MKSHKEVLTQGRNWTLAMSMSTIRQFREPVRISELDDSQRSASAGVVDDVFHDTLDVPVALGIVGGPKESKISEKVKEIREKR